MFQQVVIIANIFLLEVLLSIDNAVVLAIMAKHLPPKQAAKSLRYGILGAYLFRGLCLLLLHFLTKLTFLKLLGGIYLVYLGVNGVFSKESEEGEQKTKSWQENLKKSFWGTVVLIEIMDILFSIDNLFAAVAMSNKYWVIFTGVVIGITAMRFVSQYFVKLIVEFPLIEKVSFVIIWLLGLKIVFLASFDKWDNDTVNITFSLFVLVIFIVVILISYVRKKQKQIDSENT